MRLMPQRASFPIGILSREPAHTHSSSSASSSLSSQMMITSLDDHHHSPSSFDEKFQIVIDILDISIFTSPLALSSIASCVPSSYWYLSPPVPPFLPLMILYFPSTPPLSPPSLVFFVLTSSFHSFFLFGDVLPQSSVVVFFSMLVNKHLKFLPHCTPSSHLLLSSHHH